MELRQDTREARHEPPQDPEADRAAEAKDLGRAQSTCIEHAYGSTVRLSFQIKVF